VSAEKSSQLVTDIRRNGLQTLGQLKLDPTADPFLRQHRLRDKPLFPVVVGLESLAQAARAATGREVVRFRQVEMLDGLLFHTDRPAEAQVRAKQIDGDVALDCLLVCDFANRAGKVLHPDRPYLKARVECEAERPNLSVERPPVPTSWIPFAYPDDSAVYHGPVLRGVNGVQLSRSGGWGRIESLPLADLAGSARCAHWTVPSCVLDAALYACGIHLWMFGEGAVSLPRSIDRLELGRTPRIGETCVVHLNCRERSAKAAAYDFTVFGDDGAVILRAVGYRKVILSPGGMT
jgi:hypothetical protein